MSFTCFSLCFNAIIHHRHYPYTQCNLLFCHHHISTIFLCCNPTNHINSDHYPYLDPHESWLIKEFNPLHHSYLKKKWHIVMKGQLFLYFCNYHLFHYYILIFEGILWFSLVYLILTGIFQTWIYCFYH